MKQSNFTFDKTDIVKLANKYKTPFFFMSENQLRKNYKTFTNAFSKIKKFKVFYSIKTNFESKVLKTLNKMGSGAEAGGGLGLYLAEKTGFKPKDTVLSGPCKSKNELEKAITKNIHIINAESIDELELINKIAKKRKKKVNVGLRIDPLVTNFYYDKLINTYKKKFGYPINEIGNIFKKAKKLKNINLKGIHTHIGSQILNPNLYVKSLKRIFKLANELRKDKITIDEINIGGGYPTQSIKNLIIPRRIRITELLEKIRIPIEKKCPSIKEFGSKITNAYLEECDKYGIEPVLAAEPGRCIVSNISLLVGKILLIKGKWAFTDISTNNLAENIFFSERDFVIANKLNKKKEVKLNISGPTLSTADVVFLNKKVPKLEIGDTIAVSDTGAYSIARSIQFTKPRIAVYFKDKKSRITKIRREENYEDVLKCQVWK